MAPRSVRMAGCFSASHALSCMFVSEVRIASGLTVPESGPLSGPMGSQPGRQRLAVLRDNWLSNRVFSSYRAILDHCCHAWNKLVDQPWIIMSIGLRDWAHGF
jgi:hypothetical protein